MFLGCLQSRINYCPPRITHRINKFARIEVWAHRIIGHSRVTKEPPPHHCSGLVLHFQFSYGAVLDGDCQYIKRPSEYKGRLAYFPALDWFSLRIRIAFIFLGQIWTFYISLRWIFTIDFLCWLRSRSITVGSRGTITDE